MVIDEFCDRNWLVAVKDDLEIGRNLKVLIFFAR